METCVIQPTSRGRNIEEEGFIWKLLACVKKSVQTDTKEEEICIHTSIDTSSDVCQIESLSTNAVIWYYEVCDKKMVINKACYYQV